ncbi:MAG: ATP-binding protein [Candidatus Altiarchaeota archaeon]|nr:ATP-binding protein [Candidatus Altiarchaeota archaeon]
MIVGQVIGSTTLRSFRFVIKQGMEGKVKRDEFVTVEESVSGNKILGVIKEIIITNELLPEEFGRDLRLSDIILNEGEYPAPVVKILGVYSNKGFEMPRHGITPGSNVELASDKMLDEILSQDPAKSAHVGSLSTRESVEVNLDINEMVSRHCAVLAMTGAGKSYSVGVLIEEIMKKGGSAVVYDMHGEFKRMQVEGSKTVIYDVVGEDKIKVDISSLTTVDLINLMPDLTPTQADLMDEVFSLANRFFDKYDLQNIYQVLESIYEIQKNDKKNVNEVFPSDTLKSISKKIGVSTVGALMRRIKRLERMGVFTAEGTSFSELVCKNQLSIIDLSDADERVSQTIVSAISRGIFEGRKKYVREKEGISTPTLLIVEEAHNFIPRSDEGYYNPAKKIIRKIAREGRKFGVGLCIVSQRPNKLDADVLSQCNTQLIMKIVNPADQEYIRQSVETVTEDIVRDLPGLGRGEAIVTGSAVTLPVPVKIRKRRTQVSGEDIDIVGEWKK